MIKLTYMRLFASLATVLMFGALVSCHKTDDLSNNGKPTLYSFGPTGAKIGDTLRFIGVNLDKVTSVRFSGENVVVDKADFKVHTSDLIKLIVPDQTEKGYVTLFTSTGDTLVSKTQLNLGVESSTASFAPTTARPGDNITITGTYLNWIDKVTFAKGQPVTDFVSRSQTELVVTIPDGAETGPLVLHNFSTDSADIETADTLHVTLPVGTSFSPASLKHAEDLTITGTDLDLVRGVYFTGQSEPVTSFESQSATQLVVKVPAGANNGKVQIAPGSGLKQTVGGGDLALIFPAVTSFSPNPVDPGANVTLTGTDLDLVKSVSFIADGGGPKTVTDFISQSPTQIVFTVPEGVVSGKLTLGVLNSTVTVKSSTLLGIVGAPPPPIIIYDDALNWESYGGWIGGGWGGTKDLASTEQVKSGKSIKLTYDAGGWGVPLQLGGATIAIDGYSNLKVSIYGGAGSDGQSVNIGFNEKDGKTVTLVEGQWNDFTIPLSEISTDTNLGFLYIKNFSPSGAFTIYVDDLGVY